MNRRFFILVWRGCLTAFALIGLATGVALADQTNRSATVVPPSDGGASTNGDRLKAVKLRDELLKGRQQDSLFKSWDSSRDSLEGVMVPPSVQRPSLTPAQALKIREMMDQQRNWMFVNPTETSKASSLDEAYQSSPTGEGALDEGGSSVLKRFFDRPASGRLAPTNGYSRGGRDSLDGPDGDALDGKRGKDDLGSPETRSVFDRAETAASKAISRLFAPDGARQLPLEAAPGKFGEIFSAPASIPMERTLADQQRMSSFQDILNSSARAPASSYSPGSSAAPSAPGSVFGGGDISSAGGASGFPSSSGGAGLLGASSTPMVAAPAPPSVMNFQPVTVPRRKF